MDDSSPTVRSPTCRVCGGPIQHAEVDEAGLCGPCGLRVRLKQLPQSGSECVLCGERRRRALTVWELTGDPVCHSCAFHLREMRPWPTHLEHIAVQMQRERRTVHR